MLEEAIQSGKALEKFKTFISHQGGDSSIVDDQISCLMRSIKFIFKRKGWRDYQDDCK